ncbi:hypothetical protein RUND412_000053 [Rhizina undulata]
MGPLVVTSGSYTHSIPSNKVKSLVQSYSRVAASVASFSNLSSRHDKPIQKSLNNLAQREFLRRGIATLDAKLREEQGKRVSGPLVPRMVSSFGEVMESPESRTRKPKERNQREVADGRVGDYLQPVETQDKEREVKEERKSRLAVSRHSDRFRSETPVTRKHSRKSKKSRKPSMEALNSKATGADAKRTPRSEGWKRTRPSSLEVGISAPRWAIVTTDGFSPSPVQASQSPAKEYLDIKGTVESLRAEPNATDAAASTSDVSKHSLSSALRETFISVRDAILKKKPGNGSSTVSQKNSDISEKANGNSQAQLVDAFDVNNQTICEPVLDSHVSDKIAPIELITEAKKLSPLEPVVSENEGPESSGKTFIPVQDPNFHNWSIHNTNKISTAVKVEKLLGEARGQAEGHELLKNTSGFDIARSSAWGSSSMKQGRTERSPRTFKTIAQKRRQERKARAAAAGSPGMLSDSQRSPSQAKTVSPLRVVKSKNRSPRRFPGETGNSRFHEKLPSSYQETLAIYERSKSYNSTSSNRREADEACSQASGPTASKEIVAGKTVNKSAFSGNGPEQVPNPPQSSNSKSRHFKIESPTLRREQLKPRVSLQQRKQWLQASSSQEKKEFKRSTLDAELFTPRMKLQGDNDWRSRFEVAGGSSAEVPVSRGYGAESLAGLHVDGQSQFIPSEYGIAALQPEDIVRRSHRPPPDVEGNETSGKELDSDSKVRSRSKSLVRNYTVNPPFSVPTPPRTLCPPLQKLDEASPQVSDGSAGDRKEGLLGGVKGERTVTTDEDERKKYEVRRLAKAEGKREKKGRPRKMRRGYSLRSRGVKGVELE